MDINIQTDKSNTDKILSDEKFTIKASINNLNENFSKVEFFLIPDNKVQNTKDNFFGNLFVFQNKFHLLINGRKNAVLSNTLLHIDLGELYVPSLEFNQLTEGNILEITDIKNLNVKIMAGNQVIAPAYFSYEVGKIQLNIISQTQKEKEKSQNIDTIKFQKKNFVKRFFNDYGFEKENLILAKHGGNYV